MRDLLIIAALATAGAAFVFVHWHQLEQPPPPERIHMYWCSNEEKDDDEDQGLVVPPPTYLRGMTYEPCKWRQWETNV